MADIRDTFIGNLRGSRNTQNNGIDKFVDKLRNVKQTAGDSTNIGKQSIDQPQFNEEKRVADNSAAMRGAALHRLSDAEAQRWQNSKFEPQYIAGMPKTERDWKNFEDGLDDFKVVLNSYTNEPDQANRIKILEKSAPRFSNSERLSRYLKIMYQDELANKGGEYKDYNYKNAQSNIEKAISDILSQRYHGA